MFLGLDASTQSLTALLIDPAAQRIVARESVNFGQDLPAFRSPSGFLPGGTNGVVHADPRMWLEALDLVLARLAAKQDLSGVQAIGGSGQQHGSVYLDESFASRLDRLDPSIPLAEQIAPALTRATSPIWMDTSTGAECAEIAAAAGGQKEVRRISGSSATERFTGPQIRRFFKTDPEAYARTASIHLVSSFLASVLAGQPAPVDTGDGAGMNLLDLPTLRWSDVLLAATAPGLKEKLPAIAVRPEVFSCISPYFLQKYGFSRNCGIAPFTGDNPASLTGMGASRPGRCVISLGTSDTFFAAMERPVTDPDGYGHVFGNPAGGFLSLICFRNGSLAREALRDELHLDWSAFDLGGLAATPPGNHGNLMLPFFGPEITPRRDFTSPVRQGSEDFVAGGDPPAQVRALLEGQFLNMRLHSAWIGPRPDLIRLTGGASQNDGIARIASDVFQSPAERLALPDSAALGSAFIAALACGGDLDHLEATFCHAEATPRIEPDRTTAPVYDTALERFRELLHSKAQTAF